MSPMDAMIGQVPMSEALRSELAAAQQRIADLEREIERLREAEASAPGTHVTDMRLLEMECMLVKQAMERSARRA